MGVDKSFTKVIENVLGRGVSAMQRLPPLYGEIMVGQAITCLGLLTSVGMTELREAMRLQEK